MNRDAQPSTDACREFLAAVEYIVDIEDQTMTVWDALAGAIAAWLDPALVGETYGGDPLRSVLRELLDSTPDVGAPGGVRVGDAIEAAITAWATAASDRVNDGHPFAYRS